GGRIAGNEVPIRAWAGVHPVERTRQTLRPTRFGIRRDRSSRSRHICHVAHGQWRNADPAGKTGIFVSRPPIRVPARQVPAATIRATLGTGHSHSDAETNFLRSPAGT